LTITVPRLREAGGAPLRPASGEDPDIGVSPVIDDLGQFEARPAVSAFAINNQGLSPGKSERRR